MVLLFFRKTKESISCYKLKYKMAYIGNVRLDQFSPSLVSSSHRLYALFCPFKNEDTKFWNCGHLESEKSSKVFSSNLATDQ